MSSSDFKDKIRKEKFGIICRVSVDTKEDTEEYRTMLYRKDLTPEEKDYRDLMRSGEWVSEHSTYEYGQTWEWGTPTDYMGKGAKLLLYDKYERAITVIADVLPDDVFIDGDNYHKVRNIMKPFPQVLKKPIPLEIIRNVTDLFDISKARQFIDITKNQYEELMSKYNQYLGEI